MRGVMVGRDTAPENSTEVLSVEKRIARLANILGITEGDIMRGRTDGSIPQVLDSLEFEVAFATAYIAARRQIDGPKSN